MTERSETDDPKTRLADVARRLGATVEAAVDVAGVLTLNGAPIPPSDGAYPDWLLEAAVLRALAPRHVLFLCVANSARSQMAEGLARALAPEGVTISSAGSNPTSVRPQAVAVLREVGIDISGQASKGVDAVTGEVDAVVTLCAEEVCPVWLGRARRLHWGLLDPAGAGESPEEELTAFRQVRDELRMRLRALFGR